MSIINYCANGFVAHSEKSIEQHWISISTFLAFKMTYCEMFFYIKCNSLRRAVYFDDLLHCILDKIHINLLY